MKNSPDSHLLNEIYRGDVTDLSRFEDDAFHIVLCFGAMYHLKTQCERERAVSECLRVLKPGGLFAYTYETLQSMLLGLYLNASKCTVLKERIELFDSIEECKKTHIRNVFYGMTQSEISETARKFKIETITNASTYCILYPLSEEVDNFTDSEYDKYTDCLFHCCEEPSVVANTMHGLFIGKK